MELHQQAADILLQDAAGCTLLHHAVEAGSKEILKYLIDNGEGPRTTFHLWSLMFLSFPPALFDPCTRDMRLTRRLVAPELSSSFDSVETEQNFNKQNSLLNHLTSKGLKRGSDRDKRVFTSL